jgi:flagellar protein FlaG
MYFGAATEYQRTGEKIRANSLPQQNTDKDVDKDKYINAIQKPAEDTINAKPLITNQFDKVAQQLRDFVGYLNRNIEFSVDKNSGRDVIKVINKYSGDLLKQYPSEKVLTLVFKLSDMVGGFVDAKV